VTALRHKGISSLATALKRTSLNFPFSPKSHEGPVLEHLRQVELLRGRSRPNFVQEKAAAFSDLELCRSLLCASRERTFFVIEKFALQLARISMAISTL